MGRLFQGHLPDSRKGPDAGLGPGAGAGAAEADDAADINMGELEFFLDGLEFFLDVRSEFKIHEIKSTLLIDRGAYG